MGNPALHLRGRGQTLVNYWLSLFNNFLERDDFTQGRARTLRPGPDERANSFEII
jgi:hypothetical protein